METRLVIGIDGGGTTTRVMVADMSGTVRGYAEGGTARLDRNPDAVDHVHSAIIDAIRIAGGRLPDVKALVAGVAGIDSERDLTWARKLTAIPGLDCPQRHVNDAVIAHAGALESRPGVIVISGTGSMIYGITESGRHIRNYDLQHYASSGARHIVYRVLFSIIAGEYGADDQPLVEAVLRHWEVETALDLREHLTHDGFSEVDWPHVGKLAPTVTQGAMDGVPIAVRACDHAAAEIATGIRLVGSCFLTDCVEVALIGGVAQSRYMRTAVDRNLRQTTTIGKTYSLVRPTLTAEAGAVLMALHDAGIATDESMLCRLREFVSPSQST